MAGAAVGAFSVRVSDRMVAQVARSFAVSIAVFALKLDRA